MVLISNKYLHLVNIYLELFKYLLIFFSIYEMWKKSHTLELLKTFFVVFDPQLYI